MGHREARLLDSVVAVEQEVEIDHPRPEARSLTSHATEPTLDREQPVQQRAGSNGRDDLHGPVDEVTLLDISERLGLAQAGNTADLDAVLLAEQCERRSDRLPAAADVRAEADVAQDPIISLHKHAFGLVLLSRFGNSVSRNSDD